MKALPHRTSVFRSISLGLAPLVLVASALSCLSALARSETIEARFTCAEGKKIDAVFDNGAQSSVRLSLSDDRNLTLPQARSASGARYANNDESIVFWNKGDTAFIEEHGRTTFRDCVTVR